MSRGFTMIDESSFKSGSSIKLKQDRLHPMMDMLNLMVDMSILPPFTMRWDYITFDHENVKVDFNFVS